MNLTELFEHDKTMRETDFRMFKACNDASRNWAYKPEFYELKNKLLKQFGRANGYDLQVIERECNACHGTGIYTRGGYQVAQCNRCDDGRYETVKVLLERWVMNGELFHNPVGRVGMVRAQHVTETIKGLVEHTPPDINPDFAHFCLLYKYDMTGFLDRQRRLAKIVDRKRWGECARGSDNFFQTLQRYYYVREDELPF